MNQDNPVGFFRQYFIACFQPSKYKQLLQKKQKSHIGYVCLLILFLVFIESVIPFAAWDVSVGGIQNLIMNRFPDFSIENGSMEIASPVSFDIGSILHVEIDSGMETFGASHFDTTYQEEILIGEKNLVIRTGNRMSELSFDSMKKSVIDKEKLVSAIPLFYGCMVFYFLAMLVSKGVQYLLMAAVFAFICRAGVRTPDGRSVSFKEAFVISVYAKTLFSFISSLNTCLGYLISSFLLMCISVFLTINYIYRAEVSILQPEIS